MRQLSDLQGFVKMDFEKRSFTVTGTPPPDAESLRRFSYGMTTVILFLSTTSLFMRVAARWKQYKGLKLDDYLILVGYFIALMPAICIYILLQFGLGYHMTNLDQRTKTIFLKTDFALQRANQPALACIKISILVFYMRIFTTKTFKIAAWANIIFTLLWAIIGWCINLTVCHPVSFFYDRTTPGGYCGSQQISGAVNGGLGVLGDVLILGLPVLMIRKLQLNTRKKIAVGAIFMLGGFVCVASAVRIVVVSQAEPKDVTYAQASAATWTAIEMQVAILSANLPTLAPLFENFFRNRTGKSNYGPSSGSNGNPKSSRHQGGLVYPQRSKSVTHDGFERISDDLDGRSKGDSLRDLELGDRTILVKTEFSTVETKTVPEPDRFEMQDMKISGWKQKYHN